MRVIASGSRTHALRDCSIKDWNVSKSGARTSLIFQSLKYHFISSQENAVDFTVNRDVLLPALSKVSGVVERRQTLPILGHLHLAGTGPTVTLTGSDLEVQVNACIPVQMQKEGAITLPARKLNDICRNLTDGAEIRFKSQDERCVVTSGRARFTLGVLPAADFPMMDALSDGFQFAISEGKLKRILDKTAFAMAQQDVRYYLNGLLMLLESASFTSVATDGHRLAKLSSTMELSLSDALQVIVPSKTVLELRRLLGSSEEIVSVSLGDKAVFLSVGSVTMTSKLVDGRYPDYDRVIPRELNKTATLIKDDLRQALARTSILSNEKYRGVRLMFDQGSLKLLAHNPEQEEAEEEVDLEYDGEQVAIGFNVSYLMDVLGAIDDKDVVIQFSDANSSSIWRGKSSSDETYVVMPMRL